MTEICVCDDLNLTCMRLSGIWIDLKDDEGETDAVLLHWLNLNLIVGFSIMSSVCLMCYHNLEQPVCGMVQCIIRLIHSISRMIHYIFSLIQKLPCIINWMFYIILWCVFMLSRFMNGGSTVVLLGNVCDCEVFFCIYRLIHSNPRMIGCISW